jgi:hypothetical protein
MDGGATPFGGTTAGAGFDGERPERSVPWYGRDLACDASSSGGSLSDA